MLGLGSSISSSSTISARNYIDFLHSDYEVNPTSPVTGPVDVRSSNSISFDDTMYEGVAELTSQILIYEQTGSNFPNDNQIASGTEVKISGRITRGDTAGGFITGSYHVEDFDADGYILIYYDNDSTNNVVKVYVDADYSGSLESNATKVGEDGSFEKEITFNVLGDGFGIKVSDIRHSGESFDRYRTVITNLSLTVE